MDYGEGSSLNLKRIWNCAGPSRSKWMAMRDGFTVPRSDNRRPSRRFMMFTEVRGSDAIDNDLSAVTPPGTQTNGSISS